MLKIFAYDVLGESNQSEKVMRNGSENGLWNGSEKKFASCGKGPKIFSTLKYFLNVQKGSLISYPCHTLLMLAFKDRTLPGNRPVKL